MGKFSWSRYGGYECSSKGDKRFSAFYARLSDGRTIEQHYQCDVKGYDPGGIDWRLGKGKPPLIEMDKDELYQRYFLLWMDWWMNGNYELVEELYEIAQSHDNTLSDCFASGPVNQARALADILNHLQFFKDGNEDNS